MMFPPQGGTSRIASSAFQDMQRAPILHWSSFYQREGGGRGIPAPRGATVGADRPEECSLEEARFWHAAAPSLGAFGGIAGMAVDVHGNERSQIELNAIDLCFRPGPVWPGCLPHGL